MTRPGVEPWSPGPLANTLTPWPIVRTMFRSGTTLRKYLFRVRSPTEYNMTKNCIYSIPCNYGKLYKSEICRPLKVQLEEYRKAVCQEEIEKASMADHIWKQKRNHLPLWEEVKIIDREEHCRIRHVKEAAPYFGQMNTIWELSMKISR